jgi:peptidoglycan/LPS O-acetylase OafA/YrhL
LLLAQNLFPDYHQGFGNGVFWTLGLEEQLYVLFAAYLLLRRHCLPRRALLLVFCASAVWRCGCGWLFGGDAWSPDLPRLGPWPFQLGRWMHWPFTFWFAWVLGAVAAEAHAGVIALPRWCRSRALLLGCAAVGLVNDLCLPRLAPRGHLAHLLGVTDLGPYLGALRGLSDLTFPLAAFALLCRWVRAEERGRFRSPLLNALAVVGLMSYSLYLTHVPLVRWLEHALAPGPTLAGFGFRVAVYVPFCLTCAALFFFLVERHFLRPPRQRLRNNGSPEADTAGPGREGGLPQAPLAGASRGRPRASARPGPAAEGGVGQSAPRRRSASPPLRLRG